ncbi:MAG: hypothetical protein OXC62_10240, partial [Aestuariivita sp.]|nr:hypothetical protein [Aestuariivita sp.]
ALLVKGVDGIADKIEDWNIVSQRSDTLRQGYYEAQFSDKMDLSRKLTAHIMKTVARVQKEGKTIQFDDIVNITSQYTKNNIPFGWRLPEGETPPSYVTHLVHCGALQRTLNSKTMTCPIPSFQNYIIQQGESDIMNESVLDETNGYTSPEPHLFEATDPYKIS